MPNIREYKNDPGYYIYAKPPEIGNITYNIKESAYCIFDELNFNHGDFISWRTIQALKIAGLVETGHSGTTPASNDEDFAQQASEGTTVESEQLFTLIRESTSLSVEEEERLRYVLEIEHPERDDTGSETQLEQRFEEILPDLETEHLLNGESENKRYIAVVVCDPEWDDSNHDLSICLEDDYSTVPNGTYIEYLVRSSSKGGYVVSVHRSESLSAKERAETFQHLSVFDALLREFFGIEDTGSDVRIEF